MSDAFQRLRRAAEEAGRTQELPDFLALRIFRIIEERESYRTVEAEVEELARMVEEYDTYGQTGYMGMGVNNVILEKALRRLEGRRGTPPGK